MRHAALAVAGRGVHAAIAKPDRGAVGNAAVIDLGEETLVVDTHVSLAAARELRAAAEELTGRPVSTVLNTHWHADHVLGNAEFPGATIASTRRTRELMATVGAERLATQKQSGGSPRCGRGTSRRCAAASGRSRARRRACARPP